MNNESKMFVPCGFLRRFFPTVILIVMLAALGCERDKEQDRLTAVYGAVVDQNGKGADSVEVRIYGVPDYAPPVLLTNTFTNSLGNYEVAVDVPETFSIVHVSIPKFKVKDVQGGIFGKPVTDSLSIATWGYAKIGDKSKIDFKLVDKW